jgi:acetate kinase
VRVLVVNAGSSSLKLRVVDEHDTVEAAADLPATAGVFDASDADRALAGLLPVDAVGHRVVHGGDRFTAPVLVDAAVREQLAALVALAPLHQPAALAGIDLIASTAPGTPAVACFDTSFHAGIPDAAATYALPGEWRARWPVRRYGFHGLSHAWAARRSAEMTGAATVVTCHLGAGASLAAVRDGSCLDTTMGFTPLEGLVMASRSGTVDPGLVLWLLRQGLSVDEVENGLERQSGLTGLAGTPDLRTVLERAAGGDADAALARDVYVHSVVRHVGAMAAVLGGLEALVFTGGAGEASAELRATVADRLRFLGVAVDRDRNGSARPDADVSAEGAPVRTLVVAAREDLEIARAVRGAISRDPLTRYRAADAEGRG